MTIEEKAGMMFINGAGINDDGSIDDNPEKARLHLRPMQWFWQEIKK